MTQTVELINAQEIVSAGISIVPILLDGQKRPAVPWKKFQAELPTDSELEEWFAVEHPYGLAAVCGAVSGGLEVLDFDDPSAWAEYEPLLEETAAGLLKKLVVVQTPAGGVHCWYRCSEVEGNQKLASRPDAIEGKKSKCRIETRGEGGYALLPGSPAACHPLGKQYVYRSFNQIVDVAEIDPMERQMLLGLARSLDLCAPPKTARASSPGKGRPAGGGLTPLDDFDRNGPDFGQLLPDGWQLVRGEPDRGLWRRPGKSQGISATSGFCQGKAKEPLLRVFTTSAGELVPGAYGKSRVVALTRFGGDLKETTKALAGQGYGSSKTPVNGQARTNSKPAAETSPPLEKGLPPDIKIIDPPVYKGPPPGDPQPDPEPSAVSAPATPTTPAVKQPEPWEDPIPLDQAMEPPAEFPLDVLPVPLLEYVRAAAESIGCPPDFLAVTMLGVSAGLIGATYQLEIKEGYTEPAIVYVAIVGRPGGKKTPAWSAIMRPVFAAEAKLRESSLDSDKKLSIYVKDATVEKLADMLMKNRRGFLLSRDEISGWVTSMNQYKGGIGGDRQFYLSNWSGEPISVHRKVQPDGPLWVANPAMSIVGGVQPEVVQGFKGVDDGFVDRILFAWPSELPAKPEDWNEVDCHLSKRWKDCVEYLLALDQTDDPLRGKLPTRVGMTAEAKRAWTKFTQDYADQVNAVDFPDALRGPWSKLRAYGGRLALVLRLLDAACGGPDTLVDARHVENAARLVWYFASHARRIYSPQRDPRVADAERILGWIKRHGAAEFKARDVYRHLARQFGKPEDLREPLRLLVQLGWLRFKEQPMPPTGGWRVTIYEVNPRFLQPVASVSACADT